MWAYEQCKNGNDTPEIRNLITEDFDIYYYCKYIKDKKEMWMKFNNNGTYWLLNYCLNIKNRKEVRKKLSREMQLILEVELLKKENKKCVDI